MSTRRSASGTASNAADAQGATETGNALWGALMGNVSLTIHSAGWLEGGLTFGFEEYINDIEALQVIAELCTKPKADEAEMGFEALADVAPAGHFFETPHTMARYKDAFYEPLVATTTNFGAWTDAGHNQRNNAPLAFGKTPLEIIDNRKPEKSLKSGLLLISPNAEEPEPRR